MKIDRRTKTTKQATIMIACIISLLAGALINQAYSNYKIQHEKHLQERNLLGNPDILSPLSESIPLIIEESTPSATSTISATLEPISEIETAQNIIISGEASYYSWDGCIGCNEARRMANGEILDDNVPTVALLPEDYKKYKNQYVTITNVDNGMSINVKVTDTGGFGKYNRVADLSLKTKQLLGCSGMCYVVVEK